MTTLTVGHNIFLSREQRYNLFHGTDLEVLGVSVPVWMTNGKTTEPAVEVFVEYRLMNRASQIFIRQHNGCYEVTIPPIEQKTELPPDEIWKLLTEEQKYNWHQRNEPNPSLINLLDIKDGGSAYLSFRQYSKLMRESGSGALHVIHFVEIKALEDLEQSLS